MNPRENKQTKEFVTWSEDSSILIRYVFLPGGPVAYCDTQRSTVAYIEQLERKEG